MKPADAAMQLERLARLTFQGWNESDVRENFLAPLLDVLGYVRNSDYDINREGQHLLLKPDRRVGRQRVKIDYQLVVRKRSFWLIEAKPATSDLSEGDAQQAFFYATHPEVRARYFVVCNGLRTDVYDVRAPEEAIVSLAATELPHRLSELNDVLGAQSIVEHLHDRLIDDLRSVLSVEILEDRAQRLRVRLNTVFSESAALMQQNRVQVVRAKLSEDDTEWRQLVESANCSLQVSTDVMHAPMSLNMFSVTETVLTRWLEREAEAARAQTIQALITQLSQLVLVHRRFNLLRMLVRLRHSPLVGQWQAEIDEAIRSNINSALTGFDASVAHHLAWLFEGAIFRVLYKATFCDAALTEGLEAIVRQKLPLLSAEDRVLGTPTLDGERLAVAHQLATEAFITLVRQPLTEVQGTFAALLAFETNIDDAFAAATESRRQSLHLYANYERPFDFMRSQLFHLLAFDFAAILDLVDEAMIRRTASLIGKMTEENTYSVNHADDFLTRALWHSEAVDWDCERPSVVFPSMLPGVFIHRVTRPPIASVRIWGPVAGGYTEPIAELDLVAPRLIIRSARTMD